MEQRRWHLEAAPPSRTALRCRARCGRYYMPARIVTVDDPRWQNVRDRCRHCDGSLPRESTPTAPRQERLELIRRLARRRETPAL